MILNKRKVRDFRRMNFPQFHGYKMDEELQDFIDKMYKFVAIICVSLAKTVGLAIYQLEGVDRVWYN